MDSSSVPAAVPAIGQVRERTLVRQAVVQCYQRLTPAERRMADVVLHHPWDVTELPIKRLAARIEVGTSVISRFSRRIGLADYRTLRLALARELGEEAARDGVAGQPAAALAPLWHDALASVARDVEAIQRNLCSLDPEAFTRAAHLLAGAARVVTAGGGDSSGSMAKRIARMLVRQGWRARAEVEPRDNTWTEDIDPGDAVLLISHRGSSAELVASLPAIKERGGCIVALTNAPDSPIGRAAEVIVTTCVPGGADDISYALDPIFPVQVVTGRALVAAVVAARRADQPTGQPHGRWPGSEAANGSRPASPDRRARVIDSHRVPPSAQGVFGQ